MKTLSYSFTLPCVSRMPHSHRRCPFLSLSGLLRSLRETPRPGKVCEGGEEQRAPGLRVSRHVTAAGQTQGEATRQRPQGRQPTGPAPWLLPSLSHPRVFLAQAGEVGTKPWSPDSFCVLAGCFSVTSLRLSLQGSSALATWLCHLKQEMPKKGKQITYSLHSYLGTLTANMKFMALVVIN